jgi:hypothetical protein
VPTTVAHPLPTSTFEVGGVFTFTVHHAMQVVGPLETVRIELEEIG